MALPAVACLAVELLPRLPLKLGHELVYLGEGQKPNTLEDYVGFVDGYREIDVRHGGIYVLYWYPGEAIELSTKIALDLSAIAG